MSTQPLKTKGPKGQRAVAALQAALANKRLTMTERAVAARELGRIATPDAERALLRQSRSPDPRVQQYAFAALGLFAGPKAGRALSKVSAPEDIAAYRQLVFAAALIAHRHGLDGPFLAETPFVLRTRNRVKKVSGLKARTPGAKAAKTARSRFRGRDYGIKFADPMHSIDCAELRWELLLNADLGRSAASLSNLLKRPWIAGVLAKWLPDGEALYSKYVILTRPIGESVRIDIVRSDGEVVYVGTASLSDKGVRILLSDVVRPGTAPLNLVGVMTSASMKILEAVSSAVRVSEREGVALETG